MALNLDTLCTCNTVLIETIFANHGLFLLSGETENETTQIKNENGTPQLSENMQSKIQIQQFTIKEQLYLELSRNVLSKLATH